MMGGVMGMQPAMNSHQVDHAEPKHGIKGVYHARRLLAPRATRAPRTDAAALA
jgi:hypothetical protein